MSPACDLVRGLPTKQVLVDRAYDFDGLHATILDHGGEPAVPSRGHRKHRPDQNCLAYRVSRTSFRTQAMEAHRNRL